MKHLGLITAIILLLIGCNSKEQSEVEKPLTDKEIISKYDRHIWEAHATIHDYDLSHEVMIIVDMSIHSGKKRMFVINPDHRKLLHSSLTTHGKGRNEDYSSEGNVKFSNVPESHLSSKGMYILDKERVYSPGYRYKYIMRGIDSTNSNAVIRNVVFHPWNILPTEETYPNSIPNSWGCPAVSEEDFEIIHNIIQRENKRVLMWIID